MSQEAVPITVSDWMAEQARAKRLTWLLAVGARIVAVGPCMVAVVVAEAVATGGARWALTADLMFVVILLVAVVSTLAARRQQDRTDGLVAMLTQQRADALELASQQARRQENLARQQDNQAQRQEFESRLSNAMDMAGNEPETGSVRQQDFVCRHGGGVCAGTDRLRHRGRPRHS